MKLPSDEEKRKVFESFHSVLAGGDDKKWRLGEHDFEMLMKQLDSVVSVSSLLIWFVSPWLLDSK